MMKRSVFTTITPLPYYITRETVVESLHSHGEMIGLNPLVTKYARCDPPPNAAADEFHCVWYELTDKVSYLPGVSGSVSYKACFYDLPVGLQTHVYAPTGLDIKEKWSVGGNMPGEPRETIELGLLDAPREGLYLREDVHMRCNFFMTGFVKKTLKRAHSVLVDRLVMKADLLKVAGQSTYSQPSTLARPPGPGSLHSTPSVVSRTSEYRPINSLLPPSGPSTVDSEVRQYPENRIIPAMELPTAPNEDVNRQILELE
jgi:hypothetical protein